MQQLLAKGVPVTFTDGQGNMALHRASANGHVEIVHRLAAAGSPHTANTSGNFPLHWAVQQGHVEVAKALLALYPDADVLAQNSFGKSVSSEAFSKGDPALLEVVLAHSSAAKLESEGDEAGTSSALTGETTHAFALMGTSGTIVRVREVRALP